jgi:hypothetical protein
MPARNRMWAEQQAAQSGGRDLCTRVYRCGQFPPDWRQTAFGCRLKASKTIAWHCKLRILKCNGTDCLCPPDRRAASDQNGLQITPSAGPLSTLKKSMDTRSKRCSVIYRPAGPAACRHQLAGDRPGLFRGQEDRDERDLRSVHHAADGIASRRVWREVLPLHLFRGYA